MQDYFTAKLLHLEDTTLIAATPNSRPLLATLGIDSLLHTIDPLTQVEQSYNIPPDITPTSLALAPDHSHCLISTSFFIQLINSLCSSLSFRLSNALLSCKIPK